MYRARGEEKKKQKGERGAEKQRRGGERAQGTATGQKATGLLVVSDSQPCKGHVVTKHTAGGLTLIRRSKVDSNFLLPLSSDLKRQAQCCPLQIRAAVTYFFGAFLNRMA